MQKNNFDDDLHSENVLDADDLYAEDISLNGTRPKTFHSKNFVDSETQAAEDKIKSLSHEPDELYVKEISLNEPHQKTFHSKNFIDSETQAKEDREKSQTRKPELKLKLSHAETSGVVISAVMLAYSLAEGDKPLFFLSTSLLIFLLRPLIGALFGKHNRAVQNALHSFSIVLFIGALLFLFL